MNRAKEEPGNVRLKELLENIPSAKEKTYYISVVSQSERLFSDMLHYALNEADPYAWRAAWIVDGCDEVDASLSEPHISDIIHRLPGRASDGSRRSLLRLLCRHSIPEADQGLLADLCFQYLVSELHPVAVKVHAMQILYNLAMIYPELGQELITVIEDQFENNSVGFSSRGRRIIKQLQNKYPNS
jgi:hypothetical protein